MNLRTLRLLEYNKIVEMLTSYAASPMAKRKCERLKPRKDPVLIQTLQQETRDALIRLNTQGNLSFAGLRDIGASIKRLEEDDTVIISCFIRGIGKVLPIPADAVFIEILRIIDQPVMGQIHRLHFGFPDLPVTDCSRPLRPSEPPERRL